MSTLPTDPQAVAFTDQMTGFVGMLEFVGSTTVPISQNFVETMAAKAFIAGNPWGLDGKGYQLLTYEDGTAKLSVDKLIVRQNFTTKEMVFQQMRALNGNVIISSAGSGKVQGFSIESPLQLT
jgi:hypothetical protein